MTRFTILGAVLISLLAGSALAAGPGDVAAMPSPEESDQLTATPAPAAPISAETRVRAVRPARAPAPAPPQPAWPDTRGGDVLVCDHSFIEGNCDLVAASSGRYYLVVESMDDSALALYRSSIGGTYWTSIGHLGSLGADRINPAIAVPEYSEDYAYVAYEQNDDLYAWRVNLSTGASAEIRVGDADYTTFARPRIVTDNRDYDEYFVYVSYNVTRLVRSTDNGAHWNSMTSPIPGQDFYSLVSSDIAYGQGTLFVTQSFVPAGKGGREGERSGTDWSSVQISTDFGSSWHGSRLLNGLYCRVAVLENGGLAMTVAENWNEEDDFIEAAYSTSQGNSWTSGVILDYAVGQDRQTPDICAGVGAAVMHVAYKYTGTSIAYRRHLPGNPTAWSTARLVNDTDQATGYDPPAVAVDWDADAAAIAWSDARTPTNAIYFDRMDRPIRVSLDGSAEYETIQAAILAAVDGEVVELEDGTYTGAGNRDLDFGGREITVRSRSGNPAACVIDCQASAGNEHRGFHFATSEGSGAAIEDLSIIHGHAWDGGAIVCAGTACSPAIVRCVLSDNYSSDDGGAIHCADGSAPAITDCVITGNRANDRGGGIHATGSSPTIQGCTIGGNQAVIGDGGGVHLDQSSASLTDCLISDNTAAGEGGGVYCQHAGTPTFLRCVLAENSAANSGGGICCDDQASAAVTSCTFYGNSGLDAGGISSGGSSAVTLDRSIIAFGGYGASVACDETSSLTATCTDIYGNLYGDWVDCVAAQAGIAGNFRADPLFCEAGAGRFEILWFSPCADAPGCGLVGALPATCEVETYTVCPDGSGDYPTIRAALFAATDGDTIELCDGTYTGAGNRDLSFEGKRIVVRSQSGNPEACIIDCQGSSSDPHRGFSFFISEPRESRLEGISIVHGYYAGGAITCAGGSSPTIANCILKNNGSPDVGAGIGIGGGASPLLTGCVIQDNICIWGAGVFLQDAAAELVQCVLTGNGALERGGGIMAEGSQVTLTSCTLGRNFGSDAGGITATLGSTVVLDRSLIAFSVASPSVYCDGASTISAACTDIFGNEGGDWTVPCIADQADTNGNFSVDPLFCDMDAGDFHVAWGSRCADSPGCGLVGALPAACGIQTFLVCPDGSGDYPTIQDAISAAADRDTILLCDGTFTGAGNRDIDYQGKDLVVRSESGDPQACVIDCQASAGNEHRGFLFHLGESREARLEGVSVIHGHAWDGGGIACSEVPSSPTIENCILRDNYSVDDGGGIHCSHGSSPLLSGCAILANTAGDRGGGVHAAAEGGPLLFGCVIAGNEAAGRGGAVQVDLQSAATVLGCTLVGNHGSDAAGISVTNCSQVTVSHSILAFGTSGASVSCTDASTVTATCTDIFGNPGGDWVGCIAGQAGSNGNLSEDPQFCDAAAGNYSIRQSSPCAQSPECGPVGALPPACGATLTVCPDGSGDFPTIQAAVSAAVDGDIVELCDGTYTGPGNRDIWVRGKDLTVRSRSGDPETCVIDCQASGEDRHRGFVLTFGEGPACLIEGLTITHAYQQGGAGALISGASPTIRNCVFRDNAADGGGAIQIIEGAAPVIERCRFEGNHAEFYGGAGDIEVASPAFRQCEFLDNTCTMTAGAVLVYQAAATFESCTFAGNTAQNGGALACYFSAPTTVLRQCTFYGNGAANGGALITAYEAAPVCENCILAFGPQGAAVHCVTGAPTFACSDIYGNAGGDWVGCIAGQAGTNGNLSADPLFCDAPVGDFGLLEDSPCAPANSPAGCGLIGAHGVGCEPSDVEGEQAVIPARLFLGPPVPNPLSRGTTLAYGIPPAAGADHVVMRVYDAGGRVVATLVDADQAPGLYQVDWQGRDDQGRPVASGVYFCALKWNGQVANRRMVKLE